MKTFDAQQFTWNLIEIPAKDMQLSDGPQEHIALLPADVKVLSLLDTCCYVEEIESSQSVSFWTTPSIVVILEMLKNKTLLLVTR